MGLTTSKPGRKSDTVTSLRSITPARSVDRPSVRTSRAKMSAIDHLNFGAKTATRVTWTAWEFQIKGEGKVEVTNASYGTEKGDHSYTVEVVERDGVALPAQCECPADEFNEMYDCKHQLALATVGGPTVMNAAIDYKSEPNPDAMVMAPDGGSVAEVGRGGAPSCPHGDTGCEGPFGDKFPCFGCYCDRLDAK